MRFISYYLPVADSTTIHQTTCGTLKVNCKGVVVVVIIIVVIRTCEGNRLCELRMLFSGVSVWLSTTETCNACIVFLSNIQVKRSAAFLVFCELLYNTNYNML